MKRCARDLLFHHPDGHRVFMGWARAEWRIKREEYRADVELSICHRPPPASHHRRTAAGVVPLTDKTNPALRRGPSEFTDPAIDDVTMIHGRARRTATAQKRPLVAGALPSSPTSPPPTPNGASPKPTPGHQSRVPRHDENRRENCPARANNRLKNATYCAPSSTTPEADQRPHHEQRQASPRLPGRRRLHGRTRRNQRRPPSPRARLA